ncbi:MAG: tetratricopeptide repeat protein [Elainellaceae cyanobacterium]
MNRLMRRCFAISSCVLIFSGVTPAWYLLSSSQAIAQELSNTERSEEGDRFFERGLQEFEAGQFSNAMESLEQALAIYREIGDRSVKAETLDAMGEIYRQVGQYFQALAFHEQALEIFEDLDNSLGQASALSNIGLAQFRVNQFNDALESLRLALEIHRELGNFYQEAETLTNIGVIQRQLSQYTQALEAHEQALQIFRENNNSLEQAYSLNNIGLVQQHIGNYAIALTYFEQSLEIFSEVDSIEGQQTTLSNIGVVYQSLGQYTEALSFLQRSQAFAQMSDPFSSRSVLLNMGSIYRSMGQCPQALEAYQQALTITTEIGDRSSEGRILSNIGAIYDCLGDYSNALDSYEQALAISSETGDRVSEGVIANNIGTIYLNLKDFSIALNYFRQSLSTAKGIGDQYGEAIILNNIGDAYLGLNEYSRALNYHSQALSIRNRIGDRYGIAQTLYSIGLSLEAQENTELAIIFLKRSVNTWESIRKDLTSLSVEQQKSFTDSVAGAYRRLADILLATNRILEAQQVLDLLKVQELDDYLRGVRGNAVTASGIEFWQPEQEILERFNAQQQQAIELGQELTELRQIPEDDRTPTQQQRIDELVRIEEDLNRQFNDFIDSDEILDLVSQLNVTTQRQTLNLEDVARLRDDLRQLNAVLLYPLILDDRLELVITTPDSPPLRRTVEVSREEFNQTILDFRQALEDPRSDAIAPAHQLYQWLIEPLEADLASADIDTILYAPDGQLRYIPLAALHDGDRYLVERYAINNITARSLTDLDAQPDATPRVLAGAFADQILSYPVQVGQRSVDFRGLPFAGIEVETLVATLPNATSFLDQNFSLEAVRSRLNEYDILHFATHAAFVPGIPEDSFILFGNGDRPTLADIRDWSLQNVDLVVLSACETGLGGFGNGEEILGLGYQFQRAGARAAIASLWPVNDGGTQVLMDAFYAALRNGYSKAEALQRAQIALITRDETVLELEGDRGIEVEIMDTHTGQPLSQSSSLTHPYYWAPFILIGNGL